MASERKHIINSFQMPNAFVDLYAHLLTSDEFKVLTFITRRILGFHSSREIRRNRISLSQIQTEIKAKNKEGKKVIVSHGVGLSRPTIVKCLEALEKYRFIIKIGEPTSKGQEFELNTGIEPIKKNELIERKTEKQIKGKRRFLEIEKSKLKKRSMPLTSDQLMPLTSLAKNKLVNGINQVVNGINQPDFESNYNNDKRIGSENDIPKVVNGINTLKLTIETHKEETNPLAPNGASAANAAVEGEKLNSPHESQASEINGNENSSGTNGNGSPDHDKPKKSTTDERRKLLAWWNGLGIVTHRNEPKSGKTTLQSALDSILRTGETLRDVCLTIENYRDVLNSPQTRFSYKWGLTDFLVRGYSKFTDREAAFHNFVNARLNGNGRNGGEPRDRTLEVYESAMRAAKIADSMVSNA